VYYSDHEAVKVTVRFWQVVSLKFWHVVLRQ
jgi:hypothetical protein